MKRYAIYIVIYLFTFLYGITGSFAGDDLIPVVKEGKIGYIDTNGMRIPPVYDAEFKEIVYKVYNKNYKGWKIPEYCRFSEGKAIVMERFYWYFIWLYDKFFVIDSAGAELTPPVYDRLKSFSEGLAPVMFTQKTFFAAYHSNWGYTNIEGDLVIDTLYKYAGHFSNGRALVMEEDSSFYFIDKNNNKINTKPCRYAWAFSEGLAPVKEDSLYGYINTDGDYVIQPQFKHAWSFHDGAARISDGKYFFYIDKDGEIFPGFYDDAEDFSEGLALVKIDGLFGWINRRGFLVIQPEYANAQAFSEGLAAVFVNGKWGFINKNNEFAIQPTYDFVRSFRSGAAEVWKDDEYYLISKGERVIWRYDL